MKFAFQLKESLVSLTTNPLRSGLSIVGVVFGVASVVAMLAIGMGAEREVEKLLDALGARNVHVVANDLDEDGWNRVLKQTVGLGARDLALAQELFPQAEALALAVWRVTDATKPLLKTKLDVYGVGAGWRRVLGGSVIAGRSFTPREDARGRPVALIGSALARRWFGRDPEAAVGQTVRLERTWLTVIGVLEQSPAAAAEQREREEQEEEEGEGVATGVSTGTRTSTTSPASSSTSASAGKGFAAERPSDSSGGAKIRLLDLDESVLVPLHAGSLRLGPRGALGSFERIVVKLPDGEDPIASRRALESRLSSLHRGAEVVTVTSADEVIEQKRSTTRLFSYFLLAIALISLVVGGIGIANVMLASMVERIREVGLRRAIGAKRRHILFQFLSEALTICLVGGLIGGGAGMGVAAACAWLTGWHAVYPWWAILVAMAIATVVGTLAGLYPALAASRISPIEALQGRA